MLTLIADTLPSVLLTWNHEERNGTLGKNNI
jgi:hypothetical protein